MKELSDIVDLLLAESLYSLGAELQDYSWYQA